MGARPFAYWEEHGFPGEGQTLCGSNCLCYLQEIREAEAGDLELPGTGMLPASSRLPEQITWEALAPFMPELMAAGIIHKHKRKPNDRAAEAKTLDKLYDIAESGDLS